MAGRAGRPVEGGALGDGRGLRTAIEDDQDAASLRAGDLDDQPPGGA